MVHWLLPRIWLRKQTMLGRALRRGTILALLDALHTTQKADNARKGIKTGIDLSILHPLTMLTQKADNARKGIKTRVVSNLDLFVIGGLRKQTMLGRALRLYH